MNTFSKFLFLGTLGGALYYAAEILYRGYSHWSMYLLGGICFLFCGLQNDGSGRTRPLWKQVILCTIFIGLGEYCTGMIVNKFFAWDVWDYSNLPGNLLGQICPRFLLMFSVLALFSIFLEDFLRWRLFGDEKPTYQIW